MRRALLFALACCGDNLAVGDAHRDDAAIDAAPLCNGTTGLVQPVVAMGDFIAPECHTHDASRPAFDDGAPRTWIDAVNGETRAACVFRPSGAGLVPLVVFIHGAGQSASGVYDQTSLRSKAASFDLGGAHAGFVLAADQGRTLDNPNSIGGGPAYRHDVYFRDLGSPSANPDFRNLDRLIDELVAEGGIDPARIYLLGWSNGGLFDQEYAIARHATATPGGNRIAAAAAYAGPDPFENTADSQAPSCAYRPLPVTDLPLAVVHRDCDDPAACDAAQRDALGEPPGFDMAGWVTTLRTTMGDPNVLDMLLDATGADTTACMAAAACSPFVGSGNHGHWPDGVADGGGRDRELDILAFLRDHPLP